MPMRYYLLDDISDDVERCASKYCVKNNIGMVPMGILCGVIENMRCVREYQLVC